MIEVQNLIKHYGSAAAVDGVTFTVQSGEVVGLLGPNGAGKSTTLRILTGYLPPTAGRVRLAGIDVQEDSLSARRRVGYLSENNPLYESLDVWQCLEFVARLRGLPRPGLRRRIFQVAEQCSLQGALAKSVGEISKGFRQRLGLALAILQDPDILILDEPTSALDPNQQKEVTDLILDLKQRKTVLLSTHILPEAQRICDRILIIHKGRIAAQGTVEELQKQTAGENLLYVRLQAPREEALAALRDLPGVSRADAVDELEPGCPGYQVASPEDARRALFELASQRGWPVMELRRHSASLTEIFQALTS